MKLFKAKAVDYTILNSIKEELNNFLTIGESYTSDQLKIIVSPYYWVAVLSLV